MSNDEKDFLIRRAEYSENLADQHLHNAMEHEKAKRFYKEAFGYFKKAGDKDSCIRVKAKYDETVLKLKEKES